MAEATQEETTQEVKIKCPHCEREIAVTMQLRTSVISQLRSARHAVIKCEFCDEPIKVLAAMRRKIIGGIRTPAMRRASANNGKSGGRPLSDAVKPASLLRREYREQKRKAQAVAELEQAKTLTAQAVAEQSEPASSEPAQTSELAHAQIEAAPSTIVKKTRRAQTRA